METLMNNSCKQLRFPSLALTTCDFWFLSLSSFPSHNKTKTSYFSFLTLLLLLIMAFSTPLKLILTILLSLTLFTIINIHVDAQIEETTLNLSSDVLEWPTTMSSLYNELAEDNEEDIDSDFSRRSLFWSRVKYYISYGALAANRIPCPPRSGRSYYTHKCYEARGPVHPYTRGCSAITRCRR
ncbi:protein RALF-like 34 [Lathyrus oleraceus]|nr:protein RALF-like 34 [Pisum sativum]